MKSQKQNSGNGQQQSQKQKANRKKQSLKKSSSRTRVWLSRLLIVLVLVGLFVLWDAYKDRFYVFEPEALQHIAKEAIAKANSTQELFDLIVKTLLKTHPNNINSEQKWVYNNAGGAMGAMYLIHASLTEYILIFGTPLGTEGHSGRFLVDDYFIILEGEQWSFSEGKLQREVYRPGDMHHLPRGHAQHYRIPDHCWALEYARGFIPLTLPFGLADTLSSTLDFYTLLRTFYLYGCSVSTQLLHGKL